MSPLGAQAQELHWEPELDHARQLHRDHVVIDTEAPVFTSQLILSEGMVDLAHRMLEARESRSAIKMALGARLAEELETDSAARSAYADHWRASGVTAISSSVYDVGLPWHAWAETLRELKTGQRIVDAMGGELTFCRSAAEIAVAQAAGSLGIIQNLQNTDPLEDQLDRVDELYDAGVRICQLTYNLRTRYGDGCLERRDGGLSRLGEALIERLNRLGILIDLSHCSDLTTLDTVTSSSVPVACTHTSARAISHSARGKPDDVLRAVAEAGGYVGILLVPFFLLTREASESHGGNARLADVVEHVQHALNVCGEDAIGIGTDWSKPFQDALNWTGGGALAARSQTPGFDWVGWRPQDGYSRSVYTEAFETWDHWPRITAALLSAGLPEATVTKIIGGNFLRVFGAACRG